jgi:glycosyltransferase involved in cell wall biosynthesis
MEEEVRRADAVPLLTRLRRLLRRWRRPNRRVRRAARRANRAKHPSSHAAGRPSSARPQASPDGQLRANVIGYFTGEFGVAESGRALVSAARAADIELALINVQAPSSARAADRRLEDALGDAAPHPINIVCVNAEQTPAVIAELGDRVFAGRYNIGLWFWELARFPPTWVAASDRMDEIWTATEFVAASIRGATSRPVRTVGIAVDATPSRAYRRSDFGLPEEAFTFLFSFDFNSYVGRKNPVATVRAFQSAFPRGDSRVALVLKSTNGAHRATLLGELQASLHDDPRIHLVDRFMDRDEMYGLESVADAYVSLHRSEGFGLGLAESMFLGKPVIGTAYGGNTDFMDSSNSCLVDYRLIEVQRGEYPFGDGQVWADPDVEQAASFMRRLVEHPSFAADLGRRAQAHVREALSATSVGSRLRAALTASTE